MTQPLSHQRTTCRLCGSHNLVAALSLVATPPANAFVTSEQRSETQPTFPLELFLCSECAHLQLTEIVDPALLFGHYVYVSGTSPSFVRHFEKYAEQILQNYHPDPKGLVVDIGSNDGTLLRFFQQAGHPVLGIDPAQEIAEQANAQGIETLNTFFSPSLAEKIRSSRGPAEVVTANNVFAHIDNLRAVVEGVRHLLAPKGVFLFEVSYLVDVVEKTLFDTIYHEHLSYHSVKPLIPFFASLGMELIGAHRVSSHGGSLRCVVQHAGGPHSVDSSVEQAVALEEQMQLHQVETYHRFGQQIETIKIKLLAFLKSTKKKGKVVAGFGAPAKATTLMYHFGIGPKLCPYIVDDSPLKQGLFTPGQHIPVIPTSEIIQRNPDYLLILAWNFAEPIIQNHQAFHARGGRFVVPLPDLEII